MKLQSNWNLPNLKDAQKRSKELVSIERATFSIPTQIKNIGQGKQYYLRTYGCQANQRDSETIAGILQEMMYKPCQDPQDADLIILNTCAIRKNAEDKVFGEIGALKRLKKEKPDLIFGLCGCMSQEEGVVELIIEKYRHVDLIFGTHNIHHLPQLLFEVMNTHKRKIEVYSKEGEVIENLPVKRFGQHKAWVNIMYGCDKFCTYCIVPYTRGKERSRLLEDIIIELKQLEKEGFKEITLLGQNVNAYGKDLGIEDGFATLLRECAKIDIPRVRFMTSHPWDFSDAMIEVIKESSNMMPFIHLPMQSGDDKILKLMGRRYTSEQYLNLFEKIKVAIPHCAFSTDIIVGFPNENDEQFKKTLDMVDKCKFDNVFSFVYSPRSGTPAAQMKDNIDGKIKDERLAILNARWGAYARIKNEAYLGEVVEVLVDGASKKNANTLSGYTPTNKLVNFSSSEVGCGDIALVKISACKTFSLDGEFIRKK